MTHPSSSKIAFAAVIAAGLAGCGNVTEGYSPYSLTGRALSTESMPQGPAYVTTDGAPTVTPVVKRRFDPGSRTYTDEPVGQMYIVGKSRPAELRVCTSAVPVFGGVTYDRVTGRLISPQQIATEERRRFCPGYDSGIAPVFR